MEDIARQLAGSFKSDLWDRLVLQASEQDASIRHAVIAIAALKSTTKSLRPQQLKLADGGDNARLHHQFALQQYDRAISSMRKAAVDGKQDLRTTLITCIVIICFESFSGNHDSAVQQTLVGINLVENFLKDGPACTQPYDFSSIEQEIVHAFGRLDIQAMSFLDPRPPGYHDVTQNEHCPPTFDETVSVFTTLEEARRYLTYSVQLMMHFIASLYSKDCRATGSLEMDVSMCIPDDKMEQRNSHLAALENWSTSFAPLLKYSLTRKDLRLGAVALELQHTTAYFSIAVLRSSNEAYPNTHRLMPLFKKLVSLSEEILEHPTMNEDNTAYMFEMHTICPLYAVAWRCPQRSLRRKAISLLLSRPRREALWDSVLVGKLAEWIMLLEEQNFEGEYAPEHIRCTQADIVDFNMVARKAKVRCFLPTEDSELQTEWSTILTW